MRRKLGFAIMIAVLVIVTVFSAAGCRDKKGSVVKLDFAEGAFKETYSVDETLDLTNSYILATYEDGSVSRVRITPEMVSGFSSAVATSSGKLSVSYGGQSIVWLYTVKGSGGVQTSFRLKPVAVKSAAANEYTVYVNAEGIGANGIYAVAFDVALVSLASEGACEVSAEGWNISVNVTDSANFRVVMWSADGYASVAEGATLVSFKVTGTKGAVSVQNASVSDGTADYTVPGATYTIQ